MVTVHFADLFLWVYVKLFGGNENLNIGVAKVIPLLLLSQALCNCLPFIFGLTDKIRLSRSTADHPRITVYHFTCAIQK